MPKLVRVHVFIDGLVQGVYFRSFTKREADARGVKGYVRNLPDGRVEAVFEGEEEKVLEMIEICKRGPPAAIVTNIDVIWEEYKGEYKKFEIIY